jgi:hypothetical protein
VMKQYQDTSVNYFCAIVVVSKYNGHVVCTVLRVKGQRDLKNDDS